MHLWCCKEARTLLNAEVELPAKTEHALINSVAVMASRGQSFSISPSTLPDQSGQHKHNEHLISHLKFLTKPNQGDYT